MTGVFIRREDGDADTHRHKAKRRHGSQGKRTQDKNNPANTLILSLQTMRKEISVKLPVCVVHYGSPHTPTQLGRAISPWEVHCEA